jgi:hypothetical protein
MAINSFDIKTIADFFLLSVAGSMILFSPIASSRLTGNGLIKLLTNVAIGALVISIVIQIISAGLFFSHILNLKISTLFAMMLITTLHQDDKSKLMWGLYGVASIIPLYLVAALVSFQALPTIFLISASLLLGVITYSMTLGHWYLVVPKLSETPLKIAAIITWIILGAKILWSSYSIYSHYDFFEEQTMLGAGYAFNWMLLLMRLSFGYAVIAGMSYFNWKLLKLRSIQSSTGILYAMTFFVFIGELVSTYIFFNYGLYI